MKDLLIIFLFGVVLFALGILVLRREKRLYGDSVVTTAKLIRFYEYHDQHKQTMYTMEVDYKTQDGTIVHAKEQGGTNHPKYAVGAEFDIYYSREKPELFLVCGDNSRKYAIYGMTAVGLILIVVFGYLLLTGGVH